MKIFLNLASSLVREQNAFIKTKFFVKEILVVTLLLFSIVFVAHSATRTASTTGNWSSTATWGGASIPTSTDDVIINASVTVTVDANSAARTVVINGTINVDKNITNIVENNLTINNGGTLAFKSGGGQTLVVKGNLTNNGTANLNQADVIVVGNFVSPVTSTLQNQGNLVIGGNASGIVNQNGGNQVYAVNPNADYSALSVTPGSVITTLPTDAALLTLINTYITGSCAFSSTGPANVNCTAGSSATLITSTTATSPSFSWEENRGSGWNVLTNTGVYSGAKTSSLVISDVTGKSLYTYRCKVSGVSPTCSEYSYSSTLTIIPAIALSSSNPAIAAANLFQASTKQPIYTFSTSVTSANVTLNSVTFTTSGTYAATDVLKFQLWYNTVNSLVSATQIGSDITTSLAAGAHTFNALSQVTNAGSLGYLWITANIASTATINKNISVNALTTSNITYSSGIKSGTAFAGSPQTIILIVDADGDLVPDAFDLDDDNDGIPDDIENAPCNAILTELFPNSHFDAGAAGIISDYVYRSSDGYPEGIYTVTTNPLSWHSAFSPCGDATTGTGNMMVVNASSVSGKSVWSSGSIPITSFKDYTFSLNLASVHPTSPAQLIFRINGTNIGAQFNATASTCAWDHVQATWNSGNATSATFEIINLNTDPGGNDFALDDISCTFRADCDSDADGIPDRLDLDSDNDGIYDLVEAGGSDALNDGIYDNLTDTDGDGLADALDNKNSGHGGIEVTNGTPLPNADTDTDGVVNRIDSDSDADGCNDVNEAGFTDTNFDGKLGGLPLTVTPKGKVIGAGGYTTPSNLDGSGGFDFLQKGPVISLQPPTNKNICSLSGSNTSLSVTATGAATYIWQVSTNNGTSWTNLTNAGIYSTVNTNTLTITGVTVAYDKYLYRVQLSHPAYICSPLNSAITTLRVHSSKPSTPSVIAGYIVSCPTQSSNYHVSGATDVIDYTWTVPVGWNITSGSLKDTITVTSGTTGQNGNIVVIANNSCGASPSSTLAVSSVNTSPSFTASPISNLCTSTDVTYSTQQSKTNYVWVVPGTLSVDYSITSGGITTSDYTVTLKWLNAGSKTVSVNYSAGGCNGTAVSSTVTVTPTPTTGPLYRKPNQ